MSRKLSKRPPGKETVANAGVCGDVRAWPAETYRHARPWRPPAGPRGRQPPRRHSDEVTHAQSAVFPPSYPDVLSRQSWQGLSPCTGPSKGASHPSSKGGARPDGRQRLPSRRRG